MSDPKSHHEGQEVAAVRNEITVEMPGERYPPENLNELVKDPHVDIATEKRGVHNEVTGEVGVCIQATEIHGGIRPSQKGGTGSMTGPEHYREAEACLQLSRQAMEVSRQEITLALGQVHATLALVAACTGVGSTNAWKAVIRP
jgi:hypothetical protein